MTMDKETIRIEIVSQTERAVKVKLDALVGGTIERTVAVWFPLSQVEIANDGKTMTVPSWLLNKKEDELTERDGWRNTWSFLPAVVQG
jgi:hypothetical protein